MPKYLPRTLEGSLSQLDAIILQHSAHLASAADAKVSVADLCRLVQLRLDLEDRFTATNPEPGFIAWVDPAWMLDDAEVPSALEGLERIRAEYQARLDAKPLNNDRNP